MQGGHPLPLSFCLFVGWIVSKLTKKKSLERIQFFKKNLFLLHCEIRYNFSQIFQIPDFDECVRFGAVGMDLRTVGPLAEAQQRGCFAHPTHPVSREHHSSLLRHDLYNLHSAPTTFHLYIHLQALASVPP